MLNKIIISLKAIKYNARLIKKQLKGGAKLCAVVKADAYGHGASKVSSALYNIADCFAVCTVEEGKALRLSGIDKEILVLTPVNSKDAILGIEHGLTLTATKKSDLVMLSKTLKLLKKPSVKVHVKIDTGMNRYGEYSLTKLEEMLKYSHKNKSVEITGLYSHYAMPENKKLTRRATDKFLLAINLVKRYNRNITCHISASGGYLLGLHFDMVRIGLMLYGYKPFEYGAMRLKKAMLVKAPVVCEKTLNVGESALYGKKRAKKKTSLTLTRFGYADGLMRKEIKGQFNNRCMDLTAYIKTGNQKECVVMKDAQQTAKEYGTIAYEVLTSFSRRAERIYIE